MYSAPDFTSALPLSVKPKSLKAQNVNVTQSKSGIIRFWRRFNAMFSFCNR